MKYNQEYSIDLPWVCDSIEEFDLLLSKLKEMIEKLAANDSEHLFAPAISLELDAYVGDDEKFGVAVAENKGYEEYQYLFLDKSDEELREASVKLVDLLPEGTIPTSQLIF